MLSWCGRMIKHMGTETRPKFHFKAAVRNIDAWFDLVGARGI